MSGLGEVYEARDHEQDRDVGLMVLRADFGADPDRLARFQREASAAALLDHPHLLAVHNVGADAQAAYVVSEPIQGRTLREVLASGPIPHGAGAPFVPQIADALAAAHAKGLVHGNLTSDSILFTPNGVKVVGVGLSAATARGTPMAASDIAAFETIRQTLTGLSRTTPPLDSARRDAERVEGSRGSQADTRTGPAWSRAIAAIGVLGIAAAVGVLAIAALIGMFMVGIGSGLVGEGFSRLVGFGEPNVVTAPDPVPAPPTTEPPASRPPSADGSGEPDAPSPTGFGAPGPSSPESGDVAAPTPIDKERATTTATPATAPRPMPRPPEAPPAIATPAPTPPKPITRPPVAATVETPVRTTPKPVRRPPDAAPAIAAPVSPRPKPVPRRRQPARGIDAPASLSRLEPAPTAERTGIAVPPPPPAGPSRLVWLDRTGAEAGALGDAADYGHVALSPDGTRVAVSIREPGGFAGDIWILDARSGMRTRLTSDPADDIAPVWSPDGTRIAYASSRGGSYDIYETTTDGTNGERALIAVPGDQVAYDWTPGRGFLMYQTDRPGMAGAHTDLWARRIPGGRAFAFLRSVHRTGFPSSSPDGRRYAFVLTDISSGAREIYVARFPKYDGRRRVSPAGGSWPRWRADAIFYVDAENRVVSVPVTFARTQVGFGEPSRVSGLPVKQGRGAPYDVSADGQRLLINTAPEESVETLSRRAP